MFKLNLSKTYFWPVSLKVPTDGGQFIPLAFEAEFNRLTQSQINAMLQKISDGTMTDAELVKEVMVGWKDVQDGDAEVAFSASVRDQILDIPGMPMAIALALTESVSGNQRKN